MVVRVINEDQCLPCVPEFFPQNNLDAGLLARYAYGRVMENGIEGKLLMTIYGQDGDYDIGVVEWCDRIYLILMDALEKVEV